MQMCNQCIKQKVVVQANKDAQVHEGTCIGPPLLRCRKVLVICNEAEERHVKEDKNSK